MESPGPASPARLCPGPVTRAARAGHPCDNPGAKSTSCPQVPRASPCAVPGRPAAAIPLARSVRNYSNQVSPAISLPQSMCSKSRRTLRIIPGAISSRRHLSTAAGEAPGHGPFAHAIDVRWPPTHAVAPLETTALNLGGPDLRIEDHRRSHSHQRCSCVRMLPSFCAGVHRPLHAAAARAAALLADQLIAF